MALSGTTRSEGSPLIIINKYWQWKIEVRDGSLTPVTVYTPFGYATIDVEKYKDVLAGSNSASPSRSEE